MRRYKGYFKKPSGLYRVFNKVYCGFSYDIDMKVVDNEAISTMDCDGFSQHGVKCTCGWSDNQSNYHEIDKCGNCGSVIFTDNDKEVLDFIDLTEDREYFQEMVVDSSMKFRYKKG